MGPAHEPHRDSAQVTRVLKEISASFLNFQTVALREAEERDELSVAPEVMVSVPFFDTEIHDLGGLYRLGEQIWE
jgi:hypothetical protein